MNRPFTPKNPDANAPVRKLLLVDDESEILDLLGELLGPICDEVLTASDGVQALTILENHPGICAILSDINMPHMDGLELLSRIRAQFNPIPFVVLTAFGDTKSYQQAIRLNATDFLAKPIVLNELQEVMAKAIQYGIAINQLNHTLDQILSHEQIPIEISESFKRIKRTVMLMRIESSIYIQNKSRKP
jgi:two-component system response regulator TctD